MKRWIALFCLALALCVLAGSVQAELPPELPCPEGFLVSAASASRFVIS